MQYGYTLLTSMPSRVRMLGVTHSVIGNLLRAHGMALGHAEVLHILAPV